jgi:hypothetical protein
MRPNVDEERKSVYEAVERVYASRPLGDTSPVTRAEIRQMTELSNAQLDTILPWLRDMDLITLIGRGTGWLPNGLPPLFCWSHGYKVDILGNCSACTRKERDNRMKQIIDERRKHYEEVRRAKRLGTGTSPEFSI